MEHKLELKMAAEEEEEPCQVSSTKQIKQSISVPFVWEVIPGTPKKDWKPTPPLSTKPVAPPVKLIASVPFGWEEKPGKPLPYCSQSQPPPSSSLAILRVHRLFYQKQRLAASSCQSSLLLQYLLNGKKSQENHFPTSQNHQYIIHHLLFCRLSVTVSYHCQETLEAIEMIGPA